MSFKVVRQREGLVAVRTRVKFLPCVDLLMCVKVAWQSEELVTFRTLVELLPYMGFLMTP